MSAPNETPHRQAAADAQYETMADFLDALSLPPVCTNKKTAKEFVDGFMNGLGGYGRSWNGFGFTDGREVVKAVREGWPEGLRKVQTLETEIDLGGLVPRDRRRCLIRTDSGDHLDMQAVYSGRFAEAWTRARRRYGVGPEHVTLIINMSINRSTKADIIFYRGAAAMLVAKAIENLGYQVRVVIGMGTSSPSSDEENVSCRITVKGFGAPLSDLVIASSLIPGVFRSLGLAWHSNHCRGNLYGNLGHATCARVDKHNEVLVSHEVHNAQTAVAWARATIEHISEGRDPDEIEG